MNEVLAEPGEGAARRAEPGHASPRRAEPGLLHNRAFVLLWAAYGVSAMGDHISEMALLKTLGAASKSNLIQLQAMITFMFMFPFFILGPFNGVLADRLPRRGIMIFADLVRVGIMLSFAFLIALFSPLGTLGTFVPLMIVGIFAAVFSPARAALLPTLVRENQLVRANAMSSGLGVIATMIAVMIGGYLADHYHPQVSFRVDAATFVVSAVLLWFLRPPAGAVSRHRADMGLAALTQAVRYVRQHRRVRQLILVAVVVWSCGALVRSTIPTIVRDIYLPAGYAGLFQEMSGFQARLGGGMLLGALILTALGGACRSEIAITWSLAGIALAIGTLAFSVFAPIRGDLAYHVGGLAIIFSGVFATGVMASYNALLQRIVPNRLRGRLFGLTDLATMAGLLLATGLLGIPRWENIDLWVGWILVAVTLAVGAAAAGSLVIRLRSSAFGPGLAFWWNLNEFYCKWWFRLKREGICTVPADGPVILVANHTCAVDPLLLIASTPHRKLGFLIAEEYTRLPIGGRLTAMVGCVPIKRDGQDVAGTKVALRHLKAGKPLGIYPEARIPAPGEKIEPIEGAAMLALRTNAVGVPAHISGTRYTSSVVAAFFRRHYARVRFGKPIDLSKYRGARPDKEAVGQVARLLMQEIHALGENRGK